MFRLRSRVSLAQPAPHQLLLRTNPIRRVLFGAVAVFLVVAFFVSYDFGAGFERGMIAGTVFYAILTITCILVAGRGSSVLFDTQADELVIEAKLFGLSVSRQSMSTKDIRGVVIQGIRFLKDSEQPQPGLLNSRFRGYIARRNVYYKLYLDLAESRRLLEDSTDLPDLEATAGRIAGFLNTDYRHEEL